MDTLTDLLPELAQAAWQTLYIVGIALLCGGLGGLALGVLLYITRPSGITANRVVYAIFNTIVNFFRPIPFIIFIALVQPLARMVTGTGIGDPAAIFAIALAITFTTSRLIEQSLVTIPDGVIEAARAMGAGPWRIIRTVIIPEALAPVILGYTFITIALLDMSAVAGYIGGGGLGNFAIEFGYKAFNPYVTWAAVLIIVIFVMIVQAIGNRLSRKIMRK